MTTATTSERCFFTGCSKPATHSARKLWGDGEVICTCEQHTPGRGKEEYPKPMGREGIRPFYHVLRIES